MKSLTEQMLTAGMIAMKSRDFLVIPANKQQSLNLQLAKRMGPACAEPN
jgi:hypothetical protein